MLRKKHLLIAAAVLTALSATAFAADTDNQPSMRERVARILSEDSERPAPPPRGFRGPGGPRGDFGGPHHGFGPGGLGFDEPCDLGPDCDIHGPHRGPWHRGPLTQEERERMEKFHEEWEQMTPEEREAAQAKFREERRAELERQREEWEKMTPEEREAAWEQFRKDEEARRAEMEKRRAEWEQMSPEQREEKRKEFRAQEEKFRAERKAEREENAKASMNKLSDAERAEVEQLINDEMARRKDERARFEKMTPDQQAAVRANRPRGDFRGPSAPNRLHRWEGGRDHRWDDADRPGPHRWGSRRGARHHSTHNGYYPPPTQE